MYVADVQFFNLHLAVPLDFPTPAEGDGLKFEHSPVYVGSRARLGK